MGNRNAEVGEILLKHRSDALAIAQGKSNGKDIGTSAAEAQAAIEAVIAAARIDELKELQMAPNVSDEAKDENYEGYIKDRVAQLQAREEKRK
jgi:hypothetical protein